MNENQPKLLMLFYGVLAFFAVVAILLLIVDRAPKRGREKVQLVAFLGPALLLLLVGLLIPAIRAADPLQHRRLGPHRAAAGDLHRPALRHRHRQGAW